MEKTAGPQRDFLLSNIATYSSTTPAPEQSVASNPRSEAFCSSRARFAVKELPPVKRVTAASKKGVTAAPRMPFLAASR